ncbi:MAG: phospholipid carrier-dependent glycosyltransferase [Ardenticatenaceae bacterium]|nr:phospholipid carrier-dependent glycosyltransferase [Ardenticatenaceae bacterium]
MENLPFIKRLIQTYNLLTQRGRWLAPILLLIFFGRIVHASLLKSITFDEVLHLYYGALYWHSDSLYSVVQNPPLINAIIGLPLRLGFQPNLAFDHPVWAGGNWLTISQTFLWEVNANGMALIFAGRLSIMLLSVMHGALLFRWSKELSKSTAAGLLTLFLYTFDPNILAHSFLATADLGTAFFTTLFTYVVWQYWRRRHGKAVEIGLFLLVGLVTGLMFSAKFSGIILIPAIVMMAAFRHLTKQNHDRSVWQTVAQILSWLAIGALVFLIVYRFDFSTLAADYSFQQSHQLDGHSAYLFGELSRDGWWYYFPIVFAVKTPIATILLMLVATTLLVARRQINWDVWWPVLMAAGFAGAGVFSNVNIGYRYILPVLPLMFVVVGQLAQPRYLRAAPLKFATGAAVPIILLATIWVHPHYLAYFNLLGGGPDNGWQIVVDSNIDWGQDLPSLAAYMNDQEIDLVYLSFLGAASASAYGVEAELIKDWPQLKNDGLTDFFYEPWPAPGVYAISVTQLHGVYLSNPDRFQWFREKEPTNKAGYSLFIYEVQPDGKSANLSLSGIGVNRITLADFDKALGSNDIKLGYYDARTSFLWPNSQTGASWAGVGDGHLPQNPNLARFYSQSQTVVKGQSVDREDVNWSYQLFHWPDSPVEERLRQNSQAARPDSPVLFAETVEFMGHEMIYSDLYQPGQPLDLLTFWRMSAQTENQLSIFIHLLNAEGTLVAQHDGLGVQVPSLNKNDEFAQLHTMTLPEDLPAGRYTLQTGLYERNSLKRLEITDSQDFLIIDHIDVGSSE